MDMTFFHTDPDYIYVHFFGDSIYNGLESFLGLIIKYFSSIFCDPYDVVTTIVGHMRCFSVLSHICIVQLLTGVLQSG